MKLLTFISVLLITITSCNCQKATADKSNLVVVNDNNLKMSQEDLPLIEYVSLSRGFYKKITIDNGRIYLQSAREAKPAFWELKPEDLKAIQVAYDNIDVTKLADLKSPTEKRFYDGAPITNLTITKRDKVYRTTEFDGGYPPSYIENLVNTILEVAEKLNK